MTDLLPIASRHATDIIRSAFGFPPEHPAFVVYDRRSPLSRLLADAYHAALPSARFIDFDSVTSEEIMKSIRALEAGSLAVLIQSSNFLLAEFRVRIELFQRGIAVIEHVHLERMHDDAQVGYYVDSLAYDPAYYRPLGTRLKAALDGAQRVVVRCAGTELVYEGGLEPCKLNVGDYAGMKNVGGTFPIGEVFTEPRDFERLNGEVKLFAFAGTDHLVQTHEPFTVRVRNGLVVGHDGPPAFQAIIDQISADEQPLVREFGIGLNPAFSKTRLVDDITAFERQKGLHFSLGEKHNVYKKPGLTPKKTHFHIDVFADYETIEIDGTSLSF